jgi:nucleoside-diphosphate-sugar epimerase
VRLLLTGADGFTGRHFLLAAQTAGYEVVCLRSDLTDLKALIDEVSLIVPTHIVHLAAISAVTHSDEEAFYRVNLFGTQNLLQALSTLSTIPQKVLLASSANVYGNVIESPITEEVYPKPINHYAISKLAMELMSSSFYQRLPIVIARPFNYTGVFHDNRFVIPKIVDHYKRRAKEIELGNLSVLREYNDVRMVCHAYLGLLQKGVTGEIYNIASESAVSLNEVIYTLEKLTKHSAVIKVNPAFVRHNEISILTGSAKKIETLIGPLKNPGLNETLAWMLNN